GASRAAQGGAPAVCGPRPRRDDAAPADAGAGGSARADARAAQDVEGRHPHRPVVAVEVMAVQPNRVPIVGLLARLLPALLLLAAGNGCAAMTNPTNDAIPVRLLPEEMFAPSKCGTETIPLQALKLPPNPQYLLGPGDVLGVYVEGFLGERGQIVPLH